MKNGQDKQILKAIRQQQLELLQHTFLSLVTVIHSGAEEYVKQNAKSDYRSFIEYLVRNFETYDAKEPMINIKFEEIQETPEQCQAMIEVYTALIGFLYRIDYLAPDDPWDILTHLHVMFRVLTIEEPDISIAEAILSLNYAKLQAAASAAEAHQITKDSRELPRSAKSSMARKAKAQGKKETVLNLYRHLKKTNSFKKMTLNAVADAIKKNWDKFPPPGSEKSPGLTTIKDYLKQDPQITGELKD